MSWGNADLRAARVLVADGQPHVARFVEFVLREAGYDTLVVDDGEKLPTAVERFWPDAILLDLALPGSSGWKVLRRLKSKGEHPRPVVLVLGRGGPRRIRDRVLRAGADAYHAKPVPPSTFLKELTGLGLPPILG